MTKIIDGKLIANKLKHDLKNEIIQLKQKYNKVPGLAVVQVGNVAASSVYVNAKTKSANEVGINVIDHHLDDNVTEDELINLIKKLNTHNEVDGILVQLPLPKHVDEQIILDTIHLVNADGFHPLNVGKLSISSKMAPSYFTPLGCILMLKSLNLELKGKNAIIIGRSNIVGKPMAQLLLKESCTVTIAHSKTENLEKICSTADILVAAVGKPEIVKENWVKENAIVIDVGINRIQKKINGEIKNKLVGDVDFSQVKEKVLAISPVPGGVGPMTIAPLINTTTAFKNKF